MSSTTNTQKKWQLPKNTGTYSGALRGHEENAGYGGSCQAYANDCIYWHPTVDINAEISIFHKRNQPKHYAIIQINILKILIPWFALNYSISLHSNICCWYRAAKKSHRILAKSEQQDKWILIKCFHVTALPVFTLNNFFIKSML